MSGVKKHLARAGLAALAAVIETTSAWTQVVLLQAIQWNDRVAGWK